MRSTAASFRLEMLQVARLAPKLLGDATPLVKEFLESQAGDTGAFGNREGAPDLYYTVFGLEGLSALQVSIPKADALRSWIVAEAQNSRLDFVHLCSLVRSAASLGNNVFTEEERRGLVERIEAYRTPDGGYHGTPGKSQGSAYGCLLAWGSYADLSLELPDTGSLIACIQQLQTGDGGFANEPRLPFGSTTATAAAITLCRHLGEKLPSDTGDWLLRQHHPSGGFLAAPGAPIPDLLSTAVALHALDALQVPISHLKESCLDFVDSLWSAGGGFHGNWTDDHLDCEYTYYGLLALGHLSL
jgi:prenyltransferase beta subunit